MCRQHAAGDRDLRQLAALRPRGKGSLTCSPRRSGGLAGGLAASATGDLQRARGRRIPVDSATRPHRSHLTSAVTELARAGQRYLVGSCSLAAASTANRNEQLKAKLNDASDGLAASQRLGELEAREKAQIQAHAADRVAEQLLALVDAQQRMQQTAVAQIHLRTLHQPFAEVGVQRRQPSHQEQVHHQIEITGDGLAVDAQAARKLREVQQPALAMRKHGPKAPQRRRRNTRAWRDPPDSPGTGSAPEPLGAGVGPAWAFPTCRGPSSATAGKRANWNSSRSIRRRRIITACSEPGSAIAMIGPESRRAWPPPRDKDWQRPRTTASRPGSRSRR